MNGQSDLRPTLKNVESKNERAKNADFFCFGGNLPTFVVPKKQGILTE